MLFRGAFLVYLQIWLAMLDQGTTPLNTGVPLRFLIFFSRHAGVHAIIHHQIQKFLPDKRILK